MEFKISFPSLANIQSFFQPITAPISSGLSFMGNIAQSFGSFIFSIPNRVCSLFGRVERVEATSILDTAATTKVTLPKLTPEQKAEKAGVDLLDPIDEVDDIEEMEEDDTIGPMRQSMMLLLMLASVASAMENSPKPKPMPNLYFDGTNWRPMA